MSELLLKITPLYDEGGDCGECGGNTYFSFKHEEVSLADLIKGLKDYELQQYGLVRITPDSKGEFDHYTLKAMKNHGWVHAASTKDRAERKQLEQEFHLLDTVPSPYSYMNKFQLLDMDNVDGNQLEKIANGARIVQTVTPKSVLADKDYKKLQALRKKKEEAAARRKANKQANEEKKKQKEIEKAKKILEEAGELVK
jgi:hypothetical protein